MFWSLDMFFIFEHMLKPLKTLTSNEEATNAEICDFDPWHDLISPNKFTFWAPFLCPQWIGGGMSFDEAFDTLLFDEKSDWSDSSHSKM